MTHTRPEIPLQELSDRDAEIRRLTRANSDSRTLFDEEIASLRSELQVVALKPNVLSKIIELPYEPTTSQMPCLTLPASLDHSTLLQEVPQTLFAIPAY